MTERKRCIRYSVGDRVVFWGTGGETEDLKWNMDRKKPAIVRLENRRQVFFRDSGVIGVVTSHKIKPDYRINFHRVKFRRQRGHKVGTGGLIHCLYIE